MQADTEFKTVEYGKFKVTGNLTFSTVTSIWAAAKELLPNLEQNDIQIDIGAAKDIDSGGLALLIAWSRWAYCNNKSLNFLNASAKARKLIAINKLEDVLHLKQ